MPHWPKIAIVLNLVGAGGFVDEAARPARSTGLGCTQMIQMRSTTLGVAAAVLVAAWLAGCAGIEREAAYPGELPGKKGKPTPSGEVNRPGIFGAGGFTLFGGGGEEFATGSPIPVNSYLWRASLDTLSFMPLASADPFGGVIITDWFTPQESVNERFKMTVYILSRELRSDGLRVAVFRQQNDGDGNWIDGAVNVATATEVENAILTRARELRVAGLAE